MRDESYSPFLLFHPVPRHQEHLPTRPPSWHWHSTNTPVAAPGASLLLGCLLPQRSPAVPRHPGLRRAMTGPPVCRFCHPHPWKSFAPHIAILW